MVWFTFCQYFAIYNKTMSTEESLNFDKLKELIKNGTKAITKDETAT
jgi:hypothetical protein